MTESTESYTARSAAYSAPVAIPDWTTWVTLRDRLRSRGLAPRLIEQVEQMTPGDAIPLMRDLLALPGDALRATNRLHRQLGSTDA